MRAAIMRNKKLVVDEIPIPTPGPGEVLVKTLECGICGSDLHTLKFGEKLVEGARRSGGPFVMDPHLGIDPRRARRRSVHGRRPRPLQLRPAVRLRGRSE